MAASPPPQAASDTTRSMLPPSPLRREVPAYILPGRGKAVGRRVDPAPAEADGWGVLQRLQADFVRKRGSGVPVSVGVHASYLANKDGCAVPGCECVCS